MRDWIEGWVCHHFDTSDPLAVSRQAFADEILTRLPPILAEGRECTDDERFALKALIHRPETPLLEVVRDELARLEDWDFGQLVAPRSTDHIIRKWSFPDEQEEPIPSGMGDLFRQGLAETYRDGGFSDAVELHRQGRLEKYVNGPA